MITGVLNMMAAAEDMRIAKTPQEYKKAKKALDKATFDPKQLQ